MVDIRATLRSIALGRVPHQSALAKILTAARVVATTDRSAEPRYRFIGTMDHARALLSAADRWSPADVPGIQQAISTARARSSSATVPRPAPSQASAMLLGAVRVMAGGD